MACPKCGSNNVKPAEKGLTTDNYVCNKCDTEYKKFSPKAKATIGGVVLGIAAALLGGR